MMTLRRCWAPAKRPARTSNTKASTILPRVIAFPVPLVLSGALLENAEADWLVPICPRKKFNSALEIKPQGKLDQSRVIYRVINHAEAGGSVDVLLPRATEPLKEELRVVEQVEKLSAEL